MTSCCTVEHFVTYELNDALEQQIKCIVIASLGRHFIATLQLLFGRDLLCLWERPVRPNLPWTIAPTLARFVSKCAWVMYECIIPFQPYIEFARHFSSFIYSPLPLRLSLILKGYRLIDQRTEACLEWRDDVTACRDVTGLCGEFPVTCKSTSVLKHHTPKAPNSYLFEVL